MPARERRKGSAGESEVRAAFARAGFGVTACQRNRDDEPDTLANGYGLLLAAETKRCETLRLPEWTRQAERTAPQGYVPVVTYRRSREPWYAAMQLEPLLSMLAALGRENADLRRRLAAADLNLSALRGYAARLEAPPILSDSGTGAIIDESWHKA